MKRTKLVNPTSIVGRMKQNIKSYNKFMTDEYLGKLSLLGLLRLVHPIDRKGLAFELSKNNFITGLDYTEMAKPWILPGIIRI